jgi:prepilin-type N-terminal cleavage/methylation domain-containing protein
LEAKESMGRAGTGRSGFTLIEIIIVVSVITILAGLLIPTMGNVIATAKIGAARADINNYVGAFVRFKGDRGYYPYFSLPWGSPHAHHHNWANCCQGDMDWRLSPAWNGRGNYMSQQSQRDPWGQFYWWHIQDNPGNWGGCARMIVQSVGPNNWSQSWGCDCFRRAITWSDDIMKVGE